MEAEAQPTSEPALQSHGSFFYVSQALTKSLLPPTLTLSFPSTSATQHDISTPSLKHTPDLATTKWPFKPEGPRRGPWFFTVRPFLSFSFCIIHSTNGLSLIRSFRFHPEKYCTFYSATFIVTLTSQNKELTRDILWSHLGLGPCKLETWKPKYSVFGKRVLFE